MAAHDDVPHAAHASSRRCLCIPSTTYSAPAEGVAAARVERVRVVVELAAGERDMKEGLQWDVGSAVCMQSSWRIKANTACRHASRAAHACKQAKRSAAESKRSPQAAAQLREHAAERLHAVLHRGGSPLSGSAGRCSCCARARSGVGSCFAAALRRRRRAFAQARRNAAGSLAEALLLPHETSISLPLLLDCHP